MNYYCIAIDNGVELSMPEFYLSEKLVLSMCNNTWEFYSIGDYGDHENITEFQCLGIDVECDSIYVVVSRSTYKMLKKVLKDYII